MKQPTNYCNSTKNNYETNNLKALADKVLSRNKLKNKSETVEEKPVSTPTPNETTAYLQDQFQEQAAIYEYEAGYPREEAELWAMKDVLIEFAQEQHPQVMAELESIINQQRLN